MATIGIRPAPAARDSAARWLYFHVSSFWGQLGANTNEKRQGSRCALSPTLLFRFGPGDAIWTVVDALDEVRDRDFVSRRELPL